MFLFDLYSVKQRILTWMRKKSWDIFQAHWKKPSKASLMIEDIQQTEWHNKKKNNNNTEDMQIKRYQFL